MAHEEFGPLAALIGTWQGEEGVNISYDYAREEIIEEPYIETAIFNVVGDVDNGRQKLWVIDYLTVAKRQGEEEAFHTELGYWSWDPARGEVMRCFMVPRMCTILAGGHCAPDATRFTMNARIGQNDWGILSNPHLLENARTIEYQLQCIIEDDVWTYDENCVMEMSATGGTMDHRDRNVLKRLK